MESFTSFKNHVHRFDFDKIVKLISGLFPAKIGGGQKRRPVVASVAGNVVNILCKCGRFVPHFQQFYDVLGHPLF